MRRAVLVAVMGLATLATGCATSGGRIGDAEAPAEEERAEEESRANESGVRLEAGAFVLTGVALEDGPGNLLATLTGKIPNFRLQRNSHGCPIITLRNAVVFQGTVAPHVYVDGTRATDTCVLRSLRTIDVARVEVYPQGFTRRPGYGTHAHGLILVFMRGAGA